MICSIFGYFRYNHSLLLWTIESGYFQEKDWLHYILIPGMPIFNGKEVVKGQAHTRWETAFVTNSMPSSHNQNKCQYSYAYTILHNPKKMYTSVACCRNESSNQNIQGYFVYMLSQTFVRNMDWYILLRSMVKLIGIFILLYYWIFIID